MKYSIIIFLAAYGETSINSEIWESLPTDCGKTRFNYTVSGEEEDRIINGNEAKLGQFPWMARIGIKFNDSFTVFGCGGSLINRMFVVSAAHCGERANIVRLGQTYETNGPECDETGDCAPSYQDIEIKSYIFEDYCRMSHINDLMLYELKEPAELNEFLQPICLPDFLLPVNSLIGENVITAGWGEQIPNVTKSAPRKLMYIAVPVQNITKCIPLYAQFDRNNQFCLSRPDDKSVCRGDSGSGVIKFMKIDVETRAYLIGITSYTKKMCKLYPVFTFVGHYLQSILFHIDRCREKDL